MKPRTGKKDKKDDASPLFEAIKGSYQSSDIQKLLKKHPGWVDQQNDRGETPLMVAVYANKSKVLAGLFMASDFSKTDKHQNNILHHLIFKLTSSDQFDRVTLNEDNMKLLMNIARSHPDLLFERNDKGHVPIQLLRSYLADNSSLLVEQLKGYKTYSGEQLPTFLDRVEKEQKELREQKAHTQKPQEVEEKKSQPPSPRRR